MRIDLEQLFHLSGADTVGFRQHEADGLSEDSYIAMFYKAYYNQDDELVGERTLDWLVQDEEDAKDAAYKFASLNEKRTRQESSGGKGLSVIDGGKNE